MTDIADEEAVVCELRETFKSGRTRSVAWRKTQLNALLDLIRDNDEKILQALYQDLGKHPTEGYKDEVGVLVKSINHCLGNLDKWVAPKKCKLPLALFLSRAELVPEPLGVVLIFASWNFPISLAFEPVIGAIAAGNTVVLKPSDQAPACSSLIAKTIPQYMDPKAIRIIEGGAQISEKLLQHKWDKIFFTGSPQVGRIVMTAAAKYLTPVTLELGGKCPVILDSLSNPSDLKVAIKRIASGKWGPCNGQACIGIDYMLVEEKLAPTVIELLKKTIKKFYTESPKDANCIARIVNMKHFQRLQNLLKDPLVEASIVHGGSLDEQKLFIEPIILLDPPLDAAIMNEEIFGPLLPIITLKNIQESIGFINARPKPLTVYAFTKDENFKKKIISDTSSGGVTFNDVLIQFVCEGIPFGGVGSSGFGRYHGKFSVDTFSHEKAVFRGGFFPDFEARYPPWNNYKTKFIRLAYDIDYLGAILLMLGLKRY
ncbi:aldehyde dehydrogenase family 3 member F1 [Argentina anserina]|uniref:aldehyde dehydrogenase family 3 member F1 n=1 Tax=Argentina anserina TaxID=57926 RepID=UPI0021764BA3|nr:aldehyde dehydrogenase family 3 member F1 [Potentilla anserina]